MPDQVKSDAIKKNTLRMLYLSRIHPKKKQR